MVRRPRLHGPADDDPELRGRNPEQRYLWQIMPQYATSSTGDDPWWMPDTTWSPKRLLMLYAKKNDWYLRDINGEIVTDGSHLLVNWTRYCPVGTYGAAKGLRASQWIASVALPAIALSGRGMPVWAWDSRDSYNGYMFEILADCLGSYGWQNYQYADPDRDGTAEGVYRTCCPTGGSERSSLACCSGRRTRSSTRGSRRRFPTDFVFPINENTSHSVPGGGRVSPG